MAPGTLGERLLDAATRFRSEGVGERGGRDPVASLYADRRGAYSLFSLQLGDAECEALRPYLFGRPIPRKAGDPPVVCLNLVDGEWRRPAELTARPSLADRRVTLFELARSRESRLHARGRPGSRVLVVARVGRRGAGLPKARPEERLAPPALLLRGVPGRAAPADPQDAARGRQGLLGGQARDRSPRGQRREGDDGRDRPDDDRRPELLEERVHARGRLHRHHAHELHLRHPRDPDRRLLPERLAADLQGPPAERHHVDDADQDAPRRRGRPAGGPQGRGLRGRHRAARGRPARRGRERDGKRGDGEGDPGGARRAAREVRGRRVQLVVDRRRLLGRRAAKDRGAPRLFEARAGVAQVHDAPRRRRERGDARPVRADGHRRDEVVEGRRPARGRGRRRRRS